MTNIEKLQEVLSLLNQAQDLLVDVYGDDDSEGMNMIMDIGSTIGEVENSIGEYL